MPKIISSTLPISWNQNIYKGFSTKNEGSGKFHIAYPIEKYINISKNTREEKNLFKLLFMRDRSAEVIPTETQEIREIADIVKETTGLSEQRAELFHLEMWAYVHGIATMFATGFFDLDWELVSRMLTDSYQGLRKQYGLE